MDLNQYSLYHWINSRRIIFSVHSFGINNKNMEKRDFCVICSLTLLIFTSSSVFAEDNFDTFYLTAKLVAGLAEMSNIESTDVNFSKPFNSEIGDDVAGISGALGYKWRSLQIEAEYLWRYRFDFDNRFSSSANSIKSNIETHSVMLKAIWNFENVSAFTPYIGGGLGISKHQAESRLRNSSTQLTDNIYTGKEDFTWAIMVGVSYPLSKDWNVALDYRFADLGQVQISPLSGGGRIRADYFTHDISIGISYFF
jgi:opacity protein-like surface antigen